MTKDLYEQLRWAIWQNTEQSVPQRLACCRILKNIYEKLNTTTTQGSPTTVALVDQIRWQQNQ